MARLKKVIKRVDVLMRNISKMGDQISGLVKEEVADRVSGSEVIEFGKITFSQDTIIE